MATTPILGRALLEALAEAGVITRAERVRRVVIDAPVAGVVTLYVERTGDDRLLRVAQTLQGVTVTRDDPSPEGEH